ncbi:hypothetical protein ESCO_001471 [Escovopsis weberi]|uniref:Uncharacterized protein n=1 Tax=Escovopsis weberi TaxID=150374 RepID=A0A0M8N8J4_ESCWE|nr:hypothetical protein ESCO_001471 [Escovopsis weberi]
MKFLAVSALIVAAAAAPTYAPPPSSTYPSPSAPDAPGAPGAPSGSDYPKPGVPSIPVPNLPKPGSGSNGPHGNNGNGPHGHDGKPGAPFINAPVDGTVVAPVSGNNIEIVKGVLQHNGGKGGKGGDSPYPGGKPGKGGDSPYPGSKPGKGGDSDGSDDDKHHGGKPDGGKPEYAVPRSFINVPVKTGVITTVTDNHVEAVKNVLQKNHRRGAGRFADVDADVEHNNIANGIFNSGKVQTRYAPPAAAGAVPHGQAVNAPVDATVIAPVQGNHVEVVKNVAQHNEGWKGQWPHVPEPATEDPDYHLPTPKPEEHKGEYNEPRSFVNAPSKANVFTPVTGNHVEAVKNVIQENVRVPRAEGSFVNAPVNANIFTPVTGNHVEAVKNVLQENVRVPRAQGSFVNAPVKANIHTPIVDNHIEAVKNVLQHNGH